MDMSQTTSVPPIRRITPAQLRELLVELDVDAPQRTESQRIASSLESLIDAGHLTPGDRLPTIRELISAGVGSHGTIAEAFAILRKRGRIETRRRGGTAVLSQTRGVERSVLTGERALIDLTHATPDPALFPPPTVINDHLAAVPWNYPDEHLHPEYEAVIRSMLLTSSMRPDSIIAMSGVMRAIDRALDFAVRPGDSVIVEDPGFPGHHDLARSRGCDLVPVAIDEEGMLPESLENGLKQNPVAAVLTPYAQNPTGAVITERRAQQLREVVENAACDPLWIVDDYMAHPSREPVHMPFDTARSRWVCATSVSKLMWPDLRVAALSGTGDVIQPIIARGKAIDGWVSGTVQRAVARICRDHRAIQASLAALAEYDARRASLIVTARKSGIRVFGSSGFCVWVPVADEGRCADRLSRGGWAVRTGQAYRLQSSPGIRVASSHLPLVDTGAFVQSLSEAAG